MKKKLRKHQLDAVNAARKSIQAGEVPYLDCCVSFGKSLVMAHITELAMKAGKRVLQITPSKELCQQNYKELFVYATDKTGLGIVCAGLNKNQNNKQAIVCTYGSFLKKRAHSGVFDLVLIDECHITSNNPDTSIRKIIKSLRRINPRLKIIGFSGSPYRMGQGALENDTVEGKALFTECAYQSDIAYMIREGYLAHVESINGIISADMSGVKLTSSGDYNTELAGVKFDEIVEDGVKDMRHKFEQHNVKTAVIFTSNIKNAKRVIEEWNDDSEIKLLSGETENRERSRILTWLQDNKINKNRYVVNVGILTTGYNQPSLDCVVLFRATKSTSLYVQIVGRVIRAYTCDKGIEKTGLVIDYGTNIDRLGAIDNIIPPKPKKRKEDAPKKLCNIILDRTLVDAEGFTHHAGYECRMENILSAKKCKLCDAVFITENEQGDYSMKSQAQILSEKEERDVIRYDVHDVQFEVAESKSSGTKMIKMIFLDEKFNAIHKNFLCLNHSGFAQQHSKRFLLSLFKHKSDYYRLGTAGLTVENVIKVFDNGMYSNFFKKIVSVDLQPQKNNKKYFEVKQVYFKNN